LLISKNNNFLFDKIASVYFILKNIYLYFNIGNGQPRERTPRQWTHCRSYSPTIRRTVATAVGIDPVRREGPIDPFVSTIVYIHHRVP